MIKPKGNTNILLQIGSGLYIYMLFKKKKKPLKIIAYFQLYTGTECLDVALRDF